MMLRRPPSRSTPNSSSRLRGCAARKRAYRARLARGSMVVPIEIDGALIDFLVSVRWLERRESYKRSEVGDAIVRLLRDAMRG
jgi:hypothetical protein